MAFANVRRAAIGGGLEYVWGDFTNTVGGADQTLTVQGNILDIRVHANLTAEPIDYGNPFDVGSANATTGMRTVTIRTEAAITDGKFVMLVAS